MEKHEIEEVTFFRCFERQQKVTETVTVKVIDTDLTLEQIKAHLDGCEERGESLDQDMELPDGSTLAEIAVYDEVDEETDDREEYGWEVEQIVYGDAEPDAIVGVNLDADDVFRLACNRYELDAERRGEIVQTPYQYRSVVSDDHVILANVNGELARYAVRKGELTEK